MRQPCLSFLCAVLWVQGWTLAAWPASAEPVQARSEAKPDEKGSREQSKRDKIDEHAERALRQLAESNQTAARLRERAFGHAVFRVRKTSLAVAGGSGKGVAVEQASGERTYMRMASVGFNLGLGVKFYDVVFLFEDESSFRRFVEKGWEAGGNVEAVVGDEAAGLNESFVNGMAIFTVNDKGLMLSADLSGTKYWPVKSLNED